MNTVESIPIKWDSSLYNSKHDFVFKYGEDLLNLLQPQQAEQILDLGCGTGYLTKLIAEAGAVVTGIDNSADMIDTARNNYPGIDFRVAGAAEFVEENRFDAIFSNAALHWIKEKEPVIDCMFRSLKTNGRLVLEMGGKQNVAGIINALKTTLQKHGFHKQAATAQWYFPSLSEYTGLLENRGFRVSYAAHFNRETALKNTEHGISDWIKMFGTAWLQDIPAPQLGSILNEVENILRPSYFREGKWYADYKRLRVIAVKDSNWF
jgi:trans-aconitate methyltransferase